MILWVGWSYQVSNHISAYRASHAAWQKFNAEDGLFTILLPTLPEHEHKSTKIPNSDVTLSYDTYSSRALDGTAYQINTVVYTPPTDTSVPERNLRGTLNGTLASLSGFKLVSSNLIIFGKNPALAFLMAKENIRLRGIYILSNHTMYILSVASKNQTGDRYQKFVNSFIPINQ